MAITYTIDYEVATAVDSINVKYKINSAGSYSNLVTVTPGSFPFSGTASLVVPDGREHVIYNVIVESVCDGDVQFGDIKYLYSAIPSPVTFTLGTSGGDPALDIEWTALTNATGDSVKEYIITWQEQGSLTPPLTITIPIATVIADPGFPTYLYQITSGDGVVAGETYDITLQTVLRFKYDVDVLVDPLGYIIVEQPIVPISTGSVST
jgi:hypothetical protein